MDLQSCEEWVCVEAWGRVGELTLIELLVHVDLVAQQRSSEMQGHQLPKTIQLETEGGRGQEDILRATCLGRVLLTDVF